MQGGEANPYFLNHTLPRKVLLTFPLKAFNLNLVGGGT